MADILEIKRLLTARAQSVAEYLLPHGRREGPEWRVFDSFWKNGQRALVNLLDPLDNTLFDLVLGN